MWKHFVLENGLKETLAASFSHNPLLIVSLSTSNPQYVLLYSQARELGSFLLRKLEFRKIGSFYSSAITPAISINQDGTLELAGVHLYQRLSGKRDIILLAGHSSPMGEEYEFSDQILSFAQSIGVRDVVSIGARWNEEPISPLEYPKVNGFSSDTDGVEELRALGVEIQREESAYFFANTIVGLAPKYSMRGFKLSVNHGEPSPHPKSLIALLSALSKMMREEVDVEDLKSDAVEMEKTIKSAGLDSAIAQQREGTAQQQQQGDIYR